MSLSIHHLECHYTVVRNGAPESAVRSRMDEVVGQHLRSALANRTEPLPAQPDALYFIERVENEIHLGAAGDDHSLAQVWAESLWGSVATSLRREEGMVVFANRAEYLAAFLVDLLDGVAESVWYYRALLLPDGLPANLRAAGVLMEDGDTGRDALLAVYRRRRLEDLLQLLGDARTAEVVARCVTPQSPDVVSPAHYPRWRRAMREVTASRRFVPSGEGARDTVSLYFAVLDAHPGLGPDVNLARFIARLLALRSACERHANLLPAIHRGDWELIRPMLESADQARMLANMMQSMTPRDVAAAVQQLQTAPASSIERTFVTEHAGVLLLAPVAVEVDLPSLLAPLAGSGRPLSYAIYLVALQCLGDENRAQTSRDPAVAVFAGLDGPPSSDELRNALPVNHEARLRPHSRVVLDSFLRRLGAFSDSSPEYIYRNFFRSHAMVSVSPTAISVRFLTCPMRVVLKMAGFATSPLALPWAGGRHLELDLD